MVSRFFSLVLAVMCSACASTSPPRSDPLADLLGGIKPADAPTRGVTGAANKTLALIVSTSTETQIKAREDADQRYVEGYVKSSEPRSYPLVKSMYDSVAPRALIETTLLELRPRFKNVVVVNDLAEFRERRLDVAAVVDIGIEHKSSSSPAQNRGEFTTDVTLYFFDPQIRRLGVASGVATETGVHSNAGAVKYLLNPFAPSPGPEEVLKPMVEAESKSRQAAFLKLKASLDELVR